MYNLGNKIKSRRIKLGIDQAMLAKKAGVSQPTLANLELGKNKRSKFLPEIARVLRLSVEELLDDNILISNTECINYTKIGDTPYNSDKNHIKIENLNVKLSTEIIESRSLPDIQNTFSVFLDKAWLKKNKVFVKDLIVAKIQGNGMKTSLHNGDTVVVNTANKDIKDNCVYAINCQDKYIVRRLIRRDNEKFWLILDNLNHKIYDEKFYANKSRIIGKVIYKQSENI